MTWRRAIRFLAMIVVGITPTIVCADTLVLRDGRQVDGSLVAVHDGVIDFDARQGFSGAVQRMRLDRDDVRAIELSDRGRREGDDRDQSDRAERTRDDRVDRDRDDRADPNRDNRADRDRDGRTERDRDDADRGERDGLTRDGLRSGMRERDVTVDSSVPWNDTRIDVRAGQTVSFDASGRVHWGPNRQDGPEGEHNSPYNAMRPIPNRPAAALIGRIGDSTDVFFIGDDRGPVRVRSSGRLYLGVNDDYLKDNSGAFRVTVYY